jgi:hypothetical protein
MEVEFDPDGSISAEAAVKIARAAFNRNRPKEVPFLPPLSRLLLIANDPLADISVQLEASRDALPYFHRELEPVGPVTLPDLGDCSTIDQILAAQAKVIAAMARGQILTSVGKQFVESLALMARTYEVAHASGVGVLNIVGGLPDLPTTDETPSNVVSLADPKAKHG